ncbi:MAG TPA: hypothetical protein DF296_07180 [Candidatus Margulisbacteria bacterium]|nr:hypothetical protein [Candidatus Margulisiibacteriota bacterium]
MKRKLILSKDKVLPCQISRINIVNDSSDGFTLKGVLSYRIDGQSITFAPNFGIQDLSQDTFYKIHLSLLNIPVEIPFDQHRKLSTQLFNTVIRKQYPHFNNSEIDLFSRNRMFVLTLNKFLEKIEALRKNEFIPYQLNSGKNIGYNHTDLFSHIYKIQLDYIEELAAHQDEVSVVDLGGGRTYVAALIDKVLASPKITVVTTERDKEEHYIGIKNYYHQELPSNLKLVLNNVERHGWQDELCKLNRGSNYDVVMLNHVLEHLPGRPESYLSDWLKLTNKYLIVSMPIEEKPDLYSKHFRTFSPEYLIRLGQLMESFIPDIHLEQYYCHLGILILRKGEK